MREPRLRFDDRIAYDIPYAGTESHRVEATSYDLPSLARPLPSPSISELRSFTATGLERLVVERAEFGRKVLEGAPERVPAVTRSGESPRAPGYVIGELAHRAIQRWRFPHTTPDLDTLLEGYAREQGLTDPRELRDAVREARKLLEKFTRSELYHAIANAKTRRHEVPFVIQWEGRLVNGTLDVLCQTATGSWFIADLKTDRFSEKETDPRGFTLEHYAAQMAFYHRAVEAQFGVDAHVRVHYVREDKTVDLSGDELAGALATARAAVGAGHAARETVP